MKYFVAASLVILTLSKPVFGQESLQFIDLSQYDHKIEPFLSLAKTEGKTVLLYFSGDGCRPCEEMKKNVFTEEDVLKAYDNVILLNSHLVFKPNPMPSKEFNKINKQHLKLIKKFKTEGAYPTFCLMDSDGNLIAKNNKMTTEEFIAFAGVN